MIKVITIAGPTAAGKTHIGIELARTVQGEVISVDSRQVYTGLDIGTGKVSEKEMRGVPHHLLDMRDPNDVFTAADFVREGRKAIEEIAARGKVPIIVGGTGFYIDALLGRMQLAEVPPDHGFRKELSAFSLKELQEKLKSIDEERYATIDTKNPRRLIRAIEIATQKSFPKPERRPLSPEHLYNILWLGITLPKTELEERISGRLTSRMDAGMLDEAKKLHAEGLSYERMEELGLEYRYMARHLKGELSYEEMLSALEKEIKQYAKRQMTWFKKNKDIHWFGPEDTQNITALAIRFLAP